MKNHHQTHDQYIPTNEEPALDTRSVDSNELIDDYAYSKRVMINGVGVRSDVQNIIFNVFTVSTHHAQGSEKKFTFQITPLHP